MEYATELVNYGALGLLSILLVTGIRVLYKRNCEQSDILVNIVGKNTEAMNKHTDAIETLKEVLKK